DQLLLGCEHAIRSRCENGRSRTSHTERVRCRPRGRCRRSPPPRQEGLRRNKIACERGAFGRLFLMPRHARRDPTVASILSYNQFPRGTPPPPAEDAALSQI